MASEKRPASSLGPPKREWYCAMAVKGGSIRESPPQDPNDRRQAKRRRTVDKRTKIFYSTDPISELKSLSGGKENDKTPFKLVAVMGPLETETDAVKVDKLWNFKSRGPAPRMFWGCIIAEFWDLHMWISVKDVMNLEILNIRQDENGKVYLCLPPAVAKALEGG
jgi:hypothetical protein